MKKIIAVALMFAVYMIPLRAAQYIAVPFTHVAASVNWTNPHFTYLDCSGSSACVVTIPSTTAGNALVAAAITGLTTGNPATTGSGGGTWVHPTGCSAFASPGSVDFLYLLSVTGGTTSVTINVTTSNAFYGVAIWEVSRGTGTAAYDTCNTATTSTCTTCATPTLTFTGSNDAVFEVGNPDNNISAISGTGYSFDTNSDDLGLGHGLNITTGASVNWTQSPTGLVTESALSLK